MNKPAIMATFLPQAWVNDHAIEVDPEGETTFDVTEVVAHDIFSYPDNSYDSDDLRNLGPDWIKNWHGPFEITVQESIQQYINDQAALIEALQAELAALKQAPLPPYDAIWRLTTDDEADAYNWVYVADMDRQEVAAWLAATRTPKE